MYEFDELPERDDDDSNCPWCGGEMVWCECCRMWSSTCCQDYGTCQCS